MALFSRCLALASCLLAIGCVTLLTEADVEAQLAEAARPFARMGRQQVVAIYAESRIVAFGLLAEARNDPHSKLSKQVNRRLVRTRRRGAHAVVGGPYADLSDRILANALSWSDTGGLAGLRVVFVSDAPPSPELTGAARLARAKLYHRAPQE